MSNLTFDTLRKANFTRNPLFKNNHGVVCHFSADGSEWTPAQWLQAMIGELGEYANKRKKFERGDLTFDEFEKEARKELADVQIYLDILAARCLDSKDAHPTGVNLGQATMDKFNEVSVRTGVDVYIIDGKVSENPF
jgi:hypothetical protein